MADTSPEKKQLHLRNKHRSLYDLEKLAISNPLLLPHISINKYNNKSIDFSDPVAVKELNKALLKYHYEIQYWDIPLGYLCPPIPGRADHIHYLADLLASCNESVIPTKNVRCLDIGTGANCIYPIIGNKEYDWHFVASDIDALAIRSATKIVDAHRHLFEGVIIRQQKNAQDIFKNIIKPGERFDLSMCNPPFHSSLQEAQQGTSRKINNLTGKKNATITLNFGGQNAELWCPGGEVEFICRMIRESAEIPNTCLWFSSLVSKSTNLPVIYNQLKKVESFDVRTIEMAQGNKVSRIVAWTFLNTAEQKEWRKTHWQQA
ncbi:MAG: 23S rRNA (adenine(1618)-N(6))-methyltransferase RlmF [Bacteroidetes bacterium]|nr:23S rRNA (adenine(1618)-N(6))-methyltransferase RlmF [Bacteroidota bacterium]